MSNWLQKQNKFAEHMAMIEKTLEVLEIQSPFHLQFDVPALNSSTFNITSTNIDPSHIITISGDELFLTVKDSIGKLLEAAQFTRLALKRFKLNIEINDNRHWCTKIWHRIKYGRTFEESKLKMCDHILYFLDKIYIPWYKQELERLVYCNPIHFRYERKVYGNLENDLFYFILTGGYKPRT